jgi:DNA-binding HxlR family transcriptional regulator
MSSKEHLRLPFTADHRYRIETGGCPIEATLDVLGGRWKLLLFFLIWERPRRFSELRVDVPQIAQRVLARQLRELEHAGLIFRRSEAARPKVVTYTITALAEPLGAALVPLRDWGADYLRSRLVVAVDCAASPRRVARSARDGGVE